MLPIQSKKALEKKLESLAKGTLLGLVPTMGALHDGHVSLVKRAVAENHHVAVSIFINPTQFNNSNDLDKYPKTLDADIRLIHAVSPDIIIFAPPTSEMYSAKVASKTYDFNGLDKVMEGAFRSNHFNGVGTIVEALFTLIKPDNAYFGEKDFQQFRIIQKLNEIQQLNVQLIGCPIVREDNGLAMSSRNERLPPALRRQAGFIYASLCTAKEKFGTESALEVKEWVTQAFVENKDFELEYFEIADVDTLTPIKERIGNTKYRAFIAVFANDVRLIDNIALN